jgi:hypothetical protein
LATGHWGIGHWLFGHWGLVIGYLVIRHWDWGLVNGHQLAILQIINNYKIYLLIASWLRSIFYLLNLQHPYRGKRKAFAEERTFH